MTISRKTRTAATRSGNGRKKAANGNGSSTVDIEKIESEEEDAASSPASYDILAYPADFTLEVLYEKWKRGDIEVPPIQRRYVWKLPQASRLIESFLLGLPVPPIFLFTRRGESKQIVVDGQQRLRSIAYFFEGFFGDEERGKRPVFRLTGLNKKSRFYEKTYESIKDSDPTAFQKLNDAVLRSFVIKQLDPDDDTSITHIFERLNTGGTLLHSQEIRNCLFYGQFNELLVSLNGQQTWRKLIGKKAPDNRQRDVELVLRFFALRYNRAKYKKPMKDFLSGFMRNNRNPTKDRLLEFRSLFEETTGTIHKHLGDRPFRVHAGLNVAVFDCIATAFADNLDRVPRDIRGRFNRLLKSKRFLDCVTAATTDEEVVDKRLKMAASVLFGTRRK